VAGVVRTELLKLYDSAVSLNQRNIKDLVRDRPYPAICDLGCDDGEWTTKVASAARSKELFGIEVVRDRAVEALRRGVDVVVADLNRRFPFTDDCFDLVHANQVVEHVADIDNFLSEIRRVLRPGGVAVVSTENGSSWHNVFAAAMGWQIFSLTNVSSLGLGVGNPFAIHRGERLQLTSWTHKTIFNFRGLIEIFMLHGFTVQAATGAGYHPLPAKLGLIDRRHAHFITVKAQKTF
jgi:SAM-dependent methyltransferase